MNDELIDALNTLAGFQERVFDGQAGDLDVWGSGIAKPLQEASFPVKWNKESHRFERN